jgi:DNA polymerase elongation subunit (family B)
MFSPFTGHYANTNTSTAPGVDNDDISDTFLDAHSSPIEFFETHVFYKQLKFLHSGRNVNVGSVENKRSLTETLRKEIRVVIEKCETIGVDALEDEEIFYDDDTEIIPEHWHTLTDEETDAAVLAKAKELKEIDLSERREQIKRDRGIVDESEVDDYLRWREQDRELASKLAGYIVIRRAKDTESTDLFDTTNTCRQTEEDDEEEDGDIASTMSWERDVKHKLLHPLFTNIIRMEDDAFCHLVHELASVAHREGDLDIVSGGGSVTDATVAKVRVRLIEMYYATRVVAKSFWRRCVEPSEPSEIKDVRLQTREDVANTITRNQECISVDIETKFIPHGGSLGQSASVALVTPLDPKTIPKFVGAKTSRESVDREKRHWEWAFQPNGGSKDLHYANIFQDDKLHFADEKTKHHTDTPVPNHVIQKCITENQHLDRHRLEKVYSDATLFSNPIIFECRILTTGNTIINGHRSLYVNVHGPRKALFLRFQSEEVALRFVDKSALTHLVNYLRTVVNGHFTSLVDAKLSVIRTFKQAVCGPEHAVKLYFTGSGPSPYRLLSVITKDPYLRDLFTPDIHDTAITGYNRFMVSKNLKPLGIFRREAKRCRAEDDHSCSGDAPMKGDLGGGECDLREPSVEILECKAWDADIPIDIVPVRRSGVTGLVPDTRSTVDRDDNAVTTSFFQNLVKNRDTAPSSHAPAVATATTSPGQCDEIINISVLKFNHERNPKTNKCTFQEHVVFMVKPPDDKDGNPPPLAATGGTGGLVSMCDDVTDHVKGVTDEEKSKRSKFVAGFELNMIPGRTVFLVECDTEAEMVLRFQQYVRNAHTTIGFNCIGFDWPIIENRFRELCSYAGTVEPKQYENDIPKTRTSIFNNKWTFGLSHRMDTRSRIVYKVPMDEQTKIITRRREQWAKHVKNKRIATGKTTVLDEALNGEDICASNFVKFFNKSESSSSGSTNPRSSGGGDSLNSGGHKRKLPPPTGQPQKRRRRHKGGSVARVADNPPVASRKNSTSSRTASLTRNSSVSSVNRDDGGEPSEGVDDWLDDNCFLSSGIDEDASNDDEGRNEKQAQLDDGVGVQGVNDIFKRTKNISLNDKVMVDVMRLVANNASKMCELNGAAVRTLGVRKLEDSRVKYVNLCKTYVMGDTDVIVKYAMLDVILPALMYMDMESMNFVTCVSNKTTQPPRIVYEDGAMALVGAVLANNGTWYNHTAMPGTSEKLSEEEMNKSDFKFDLFKHFKFLKYPGGIRGGVRSVTNVPCACVDATNMYPRIIMKEDVGMTGMLTLKRVIRKRFKRGKHYKFVKLSTVYTRDSKIVSRLYPKCTYDIFHTIESHTCADMLGERLYYKGKMKTETDPFKKASYDQKQKTFKLLLNIIYGFCGLSWAVIGALIALYGRDQTTRIAALWYDYWRERIANSDTDSDFLLMCSEMEFQQLSRYAARLALHERASSKAIVDKAIEIVNEFLDVSGNVDQAPSKFLFEKYFPGGSICQGPKNYCGWKIEGDPGPNGNYTVTLHVAGLPGGKAGTTGIKTKLQLWNMRFVLDRDPDGALLFGDTVYDLAYRTILIEEVVVAMSENMCDTLDELKAVRDTAGVTAQLKTIAEFEKNKDVLRKRLAEELMTLDPAMVQGKEKVGDMRKSNTIACKAAALECRKLDMPLDKADMYVTLTRSCHAQISGVQTSFLDTLLGNCPVEKARLKAEAEKSKRTKKLTSAHLTKFDENLLATPARYAYKFKTCHYTKARKMQVKIGRLEDERDKLLSRKNVKGSNLEMETKQMLRHEDKLASSDRHCITIQDGYDCDRPDGRIRRKHKSERIRDKAKKNMRDNLCKRALRYMDKYGNKTNDRMSLVVMTDPKYAVSTVRDFADIDTPDTGRDDGVDAIVSKFIKRQRKKTKTKIGVRETVVNNYPINVKKEPTHRTVDLWSIYANRELATNDFRWLVICPKSSALYTVMDDGNDGLGRLVIGKVLKKLGGVKLTPDYNSCCDRRILFGKDAGAYKSHYVVDMHKYRAQTRSTPFLTDTVNNVSELVNRDSFCPNRLNSLGFNCDGDELMDAIAKYTQKTSNEGLPKHVHRVIRFKPLVGTDGVQLDTTTVNCNDNGGSSVCFEDTASTRHTRVMTNCTIVRDDDRHQPVWTWNEKGACVYLSELTLALEKIKRTGFNSGLHRLELVFFQDTMELVLCKRKLTNDDDKSVKYEIPITHVNGSFRDVDKYGKLNTPTHNDKFELNVRLRGVKLASSRPIQMDFEEDTGGVIIIPSDEDDDFLTDKPSKPDVTTKKLIQTKLSFFRTMK